MEILALSAYHGGSHEQFLSQWQHHSRHRFTLCTLPARHLKWRMRQAAYGLSQQALALDEAQRSFDVVWTTSLCNAAELRGLLPLRYRSLPFCVYFHENQFDYPSRTKTRDAERGWDVNLPLSNWMSCLAADRLWFNSAYNLHSLLRGAEQVLTKMPDEHSLDSLARIERKSEVQYPGIDFSFFNQPRPENAARPLTVAWIARWEHDKRPDLFARAVLELQRRGVVFELVCLGQQFQNVPQDFLMLKEAMGSALVHFGYADRREFYRDLLLRSDVAVSMAEHEFFGIALLEAVAAGCVPVVPDRLVYQELYPAPCRYPVTNDEILVENVVKQLEALALLKQSQGSLGSISGRVRQEMDLAKFDWVRRARELDLGICDLKRSP